VAAVRIVSRTVMTPNQTGAHTLPPTPQDQFGGVAPRQEKAFPQRGACLTGSVSTPVDRPPVPDSVQPLDADVLTRCYMTDFVWKECSILLT